MPETLRAIVYTRVSTEEQAHNNTSLDDQRQRGLQYAEARAALPIRVCEDAGVSGTRYDTRPALLDALAAIERGDAQLLIVTKIDRLGRSTKVILRIAERVDRAGGQIVTCDGLELGRTPIGKLMLTLLAALAEFERDMIRERMMSGKQNRAQQGLQPLRSRSPYGYHIVTFKDIEAGLYAGHKAGQYVIVEEEAAVVRQIYALYDSGQSLRKIAPLLQARGIATPKQAKTWYASTIRSILENPAFKGMAMYGRKEVVSGENLMQIRDPTQRLKAGKFYRKRVGGGTAIPVPPIVDATLWERCHRKLIGNVETKQALLGGRPGRKFMLTGLTRCPSCDWRMGGVNKTSWGDVKKPYYVCNQNPDCSSRYKSHSAEPLERMTVQALLHLHEQPESVADALRAYDDDLRAQVETDDRAQERKRVRDKLDALNVELENVKRALMLALRAGLNEQDFQAELESIARRRKLLETRWQELTPRPDAAPGDLILPRDTAAKLATVAGAIVKVFTAAEEDFSNGDKQALLQQLVESVTPTEEGAVVTWKAETVHFAKMQPFIRVKQQLY